MEVKFYIAQFEMLTESKIQQIAKQYHLQSIIVHPNDYGRMISFYKTTNENQNKDKYIKSKMIRINIYLTTGTVGIFRPKKKGIFHRNCNDKTIQNIFAIELLYGNEGQ